MVGRFFEAFPNLRQVAGSGLFIELRCDQSVPGCGDSIKGSGQHEHKGSVSDASQAAALECAGSNGFKREHTEEFAKAFHVFVEKWADRFRAPIPSRESCATGGDHHIHGWIGDPLAHRCSDLITVVGTKVPATQLMACIDQPFLQSISAWIRCERAAV